MANFQKFMGIGRLTKKPEYKAFSEDNGVAKLSLAFNRTYKDRDGNKVEETLFLDGSVFGKMAPIVCEYSDKGRELFVEGRLKMDKWEKDGQTNSKIALVVENFQFIGEKTNIEEDTQPQEEPPKTQTKSPYKFPQKTTGNKAPF